MDLVVPWLLVPVFGAFWCLVCYLLSAIAGWPKLRGTYSIREPFRGYQTVGSGRLGATRYGLCLIVGANEGGIYLNVVFPFRVGAGPVLVPWSEVRVSSSTTWLVHYLTFEFPRASTSLRLSERLGKKLLSHRGADAV
jgi:hypothetical protein